MGGEGWRDLMPQVRRIADQLTGTGLVVVTQRGEPVVATEAKGPVRIARGERFA